MTPVEKKRVYMRKYMRRRMKDPKFRALARKRIKASQKKNVAEVRRLIAEFKQQGCCKCPEKDPCCMDAHHFRDKKFSISAAVTHRIPAKRVREELLKCACVCANCHRKHHAGNLEIAA